MNTKKLLSIALALAMILAIAPMANVAYAAGGMGETVLEQNFDDTTVFDATAGGEIDDSANVGGIWQSFATSTNPGSTIATGTVEVEDADKLFVDNQVMEVIRFDNNKGHVNGAFSGMDPDDDYAASFRMKFTGNGLLTVTVANGLTELNTAQAGLMIAADGAVTIGTGKDVSLGTIPLNTWCTVEIVSNQTAKTYTVTITPDGGTAMSATGTRTEVTYSKNNKLTFVAGYTTNASVLAYVDDVLLEKVEGTVRTTVLDQDFNNTSIFTAGTCYTADVPAGGVGGTWTFGKNVAGDASSGIENVTDGDHYVSCASSGKQALKLVRYGGKGSYNIYLDDELAFGAGVDFALNFRYLRPMDGGPFTLTIGGSDAAISAASFYILADGSLQVYDGTNWTDTGYDVPAAEWMSISVTTDAANQEYTVEVTPDGGNSFSANGYMDVSVAVPRMYLCGAYKDATNIYTAGYFDDFFMETVTNTGTTAVLVQDFEDTSKFVVGNLTEVNTNGLGGRININSDSNITTMVINTKDGDGLVTDFVASGTQSLKLVRVGGQYKGHIGAGFALMEGYDDYEVSMKVFRKAGNGFDILLGKGSYDAAFSDSYISIAANGEISLSVDGAKTATGKYLMAGQWATLSLVTDRAAGTYTVAVQYEDDATATEIGTGDLNNLDVNKLMFTVTTPVTADTAVAYIDDIVIDNYENPAPTYTITVNGDDDNEVTVPAQATYATQISIVLDKEDGYDYNVTATVGGEAVTLHPVSAGYTIAGSDVKGDIVITVVKTAQAHVHSLIRVPATPASLTAAGNIEYWTCGCGKYFSDAAGTTEITQAETVIPQLTPDDDDDDNTGSGSGSTTPPAPPAHTHTLTKVDGVAATVDAEGVKEHYTCTCGKKFADAAGTTEITDVSIPKLPAPTPDEEEDVVPPTGDMGIAHLLVMAMTSVGAIVELKKKFHK